jgi:hypothetical protein
MFGVTRNSGVVQSNLAAINMLIYKRFLKGWSPENERFFEAENGPNRALVLPPR